MTYNVQGDLLKPFVAHKGDIPNAVQEYFRPKVGFCWTEDGEFNQNSVMDIANYIEK